ncbi:TetR/AcrR family transcriptional regulator [Raoultella terrigena]|nr:TetR/AcrR family transcriptional regulator [Raoultella terrigena]NWK87968.1 TetR/AcrR family transcriptional regulator [Raoultella terrigena]VUD30938.1 transcriptional regulator [Raoultella sp. NCTC 9187]
MRVSRKQVEENKQTILAAAGRLFRERGFDAVTVTDIMKSAGLTHGGFYGYFKSKDELIALTLAELKAASGAVENGSPPQIERYLSPEHRDNFASGCPLAALAADTIRQSEPARSEMTAGLKQQIVNLSKTVNGEDDAARHRAAVGSWSAMVGAVILARMTSDPALSDEILRETAAWLQEKAPQA